MAFSWPVSFKSDETWKHKKPVLVSNTAFGGVCTFYLAPVTAADSLKPWAPAPLVLWGLMTLTPGPPGRPAPAAWLCLRHLGCSFWYYFFSTHVMENGPFQ